MLGGRDHTDLAGIGALWTVFCPDPQDVSTFVIVEFNLYDLYYYRDLAREPMDVRAWHLDKLGGAAHRTPQGIPHVWVTDLKIHPEHDLERLVEPTLAELLWLCEREVGHFGYPNLLGLAHRDVVLTRQKAALLRQRYREILSWSDAILRDLTPNDFPESPHKLHNIF